MPAVDSSTCAAARRRQGAGAAPQPRWSPALQANLAARRADACLPQPARLREFPAMPRMRRAADVPELQRDAHAAPRWRRPCAATTAITPCRFRPAVRTAAGRPCDLGCRDRAGGGGAARSRFRARASAAWIAIRRAARAACANLRRLERRRFDILVGTQMITKGHDVPRRDPRRRAACRHRAELPRLPRRASAPSSCSPRLPAAPDAASARAG